MEDLIYCSFCGKDQKNVEKMIVGPNVNICSACVETCNIILKEDKRMGSDE